MWKKFKKNWKVIEKLTKNESREKDWNLSKQLKFEKNSNSSKIKK